MAPDTEFARNFYTGIGPLQLGVVLVFLFFSRFFNITLAILEIFFWENTAH